MCQMFSLISKRICCLSSINKQIYEKQKKNRDFVPMRLSNMIYDHDLFRYTFLMYVDIMLYVVVNIDLYIQGHKNHFQQEHHYYLYFDMSSYKQIDHHPFDQ